MVTHFDDPRLGYVVPREFANDMALAHLHDPVGEDRQFLDIRRNNNDADAAPRQFAEGLVNLLARADVDAARRLVEDQKFGARTQPSRDQRFLLVATREVPDLGRRARGLDAEVLDQAAGLVSHFLGREEGQPIHDPQRFSVALEVARKNIRVNAIAPGSVMTPLLTGMFGSDQSAKDTVLPMIPMGRIGDPSEIAQLVLFLSSDAASFITGQAVVIDGGGFVAGAGG